MAEKKRVLVVDDHPLLREGLSQVFNRQDDFVVCAEAATPAEAKSALFEKKPDVIVLDLMLGNADGIELIKALKTLDPSAAILVISLHDEGVYAERALRAGALGYIMKEQATEQVLAAARAVVRGEIYLSPKMNTLLLRQRLTDTSRTKEKPAKRELPLSDRELHVFRLLGAGLGTRQIAAELKISIKTVETYREKIKVKLNLKDGADLLARARAWVEGRQ